MKWIWHLCYANMKQRGIRTVLTILGVVIGVISIVSLLSIGIGVKETVLSEFMSNEQITQITVMGVNEGKRKDKMLTDERMKQFQELDHVTEVYPRLNVEGVSFYKNYVGYGDIIGVPRKYLENITLQYGNLPDMKSLKPEIVMGQGALYMFYNENTGACYIDTIEEAERKTIDLSGQNIEVQFGYTDDATKAKLLVTGMLNNNSYDMYCDMDILKRYLKRIAVDGKIPGQPVNENGENYNEWIYSGAIVVVDDTQHVEEVLKKLQNMGFQTENDKEYLDTMKKTVNVIQVMLGGIGMIALVVAVIGIGNTMTTAVYDRINEIGILKVLGCDLDELMILFLLESGILGGLGGLIGIGCSFLLIRFVLNPVAVKMLSLEAGTTLAVLPFWLILAAFAFSVLLGLFAGFFPAKWAAKLKPIDAVRKV